MLAKIFMALAAKMDIAGMFTVTMKSKRSIQSVVDDVEGACLEYKFALLHSYHYHEVVASKGFPIERKVYIYEVCQAKAASMVLTSTPFFAPFMPCRIAVYEDAGSTVISTQNMQMMINAVKSDAALYKETSELFAHLQEMMKKLKG
jgi:uncharacterized protein (DUF302 family)